MTEQIDQHYATLEQYIQAAQVFQHDDGISDGLCAELKQLQSTDPVSFRRAINQMTTLLRDNPIYLNESVLAMLVEYFVGLLKQWCVSGNFNDSDDSSTFQNLSFILVSDYYDGQMANPLFVEEMHACLHAIARVGRSLLMSSDMPVVNHVLARYITWESQDRRRAVHNPTFVEAMLKCLCAPCTVEVFAQLKASAESEERSPAEIFVFTILIGFLDIIDREQLSEQALSLRKHLLTSIADLLKAYSITSTAWAESAVEMLVTTTSLFLYYVQMTVPNDQDLDVQIPMTDTAIQILLGPCRSVKLHANCIQYVYMGTQSDKVLDYLKNRNLTPTMLKLTAMYKDQAEIQFNIYRILAAIMTEDDIKRLEDPGVIAKVFLDQLRDVINDPTWRVRFGNLLTSLKILLQHDQIRDEIYEQNGLPLFIQCATISGHDSVIRQRGLENLLIMSFNKAVCDTLKSDANFLAEIKSLTENSTDIDLQHAAESLLWLLTKEEATEDSPTNKPSETTYDIMISYSHKDKDLCFQLYDRLQQDHFRVWLDRDQMHSAPLEAMSSAIEQAEFVLVCMSDGYKQSGYCKMEANYALERQCCIIPLVMKAQYRPDGWLGIMVTGRIRIDFPKYGFDDAYEKLLIEIDRHRKEKKAERKESSMKHHETPSLTKTSDRTQRKEEPKVPLVTYQVKSDHSLPFTIEQWTAEDVQQFFLKQRLESFLPICSGMTGARLLAMYKMCLGNSPVMLQSLNQELTTTKQPLLTMIEYLQFLDDTKVFVPASLLEPNATTKQSSVCVLF